MALDEARWWALPAWLREQVHQSQKVRRRVGGGWLDHDTGELFESPWRVLFVAGAIWICRIEPEELAGSFACETGQSDDDAALVA